MSTPRKQSKPTLLKLRTPNLYFCLGCGKVCSKQSTNRGQCPNCYSVKARTMTGKEEL